MMKYLLLSLLFLASALGASADFTDYPQITVNGKPVTKTVKRIETSTFLAELIYDLDTMESDTVYTETLRLVLSPLSIGEAKLLGGVSVSSRYLVVEGLKADAEVTIYNTSGVKVKTDRANKGRSSFYIGHLPKGIYLMKSEKTIVKFQKN